MTVRKWKVTSNGSNSNIHSINSNKSSNRLIAMVVVIVTEPP